MSRISEPNLPLPPVTRRDALRSREAGAESDPEGWGEGNHVELRQPSPSFPLPGGEGGEPRRACRAHFLISGFTLLEVVVVLLIVTIILGMVGVNLTRNPTDTLRDEAERLALVLQNAQQQAILEGRLYGFSFTETGYRFLRSNTDNNRMVPIEFDELLTPHNLPPSITLAPTEITDKNTKVTDAKKRFDPIAFNPSGEFTVFNLVLSVGDAYWYVRGQSDGQVLSSPLAEPEKS
ncbi:MAG TPA: GspH/FimT family protein [Burkholderiales bacterium]